MLTPEIYNTPAADLNQHPQEDLQNLIKINFIAKWQKRLVYTFLIYFVFSAAIKSIPKDISLFVGFIYLILYISMVIFNGIICWKVYSKFVAVIMMILAVIPLLNFLIILASNSRATSVIRKAGFKVGFMGANRSPIEAAIEKASSLPQ
jgi:hypothetical protein